MSYIDTPADISQDHNASQYAEGELDFTSPLFQLACRNHGFKPEDLMKKSLQEIREIHRGKNYSEEAYRMLAGQYEQRRLLKIKIVVKERNYLIEEKIAEIHPALHYKGKTVVYALGASFNRYKEPKARRELRELIHKQEAELIELQLQEKEFGRDGYARLRAEERQRNAFGLNLYPRPPREIEYIESEEMRMLRAPKRQTNTEKKVANDIFEKEFGMPYNSPSKTCKASSRSSAKKPKKFHNKIVSVPGNLLETQMVSRTTSVTPSPMRMSAAGKFARMALDTNQQLVRENSFRLASAITRSRPEALDRTKEKKVLFEKGRALASAFTTPQNSAQKDKVKVTESSFKTPKKSAQKNANARNYSATGKIQNALAEHLQEYNKSITKEINYETDSDEELDRKLASTFTPGQRWIDNRIEDSNQYMRTPDTKSQTKMGTSSQSLYRNTPKNHGSSVPPKQRNTNRGVGNFVQEPRYTGDINNLSAERETMSRLENEYYNQVELNQVPVRTTAGKPKSKCLGMVYPSTMMDIPADKKFMESTFKSGMTGSTRMFDGASAERSDGFRSTFLSF